MILSVFIFVWLVLGSGFDTVSDKVVKGLAGHGSMELLYLRRFSWRKFMQWFGVLTGGSGDGKEELCFLCWLLFIGFFLFGGCLTGGSGGSGDGKEELCFLCLLLLDLGFISFSPVVRFFLRWLRGAPASGHHPQTTHQRVL